MGKVNSGAHVGIGRLCEIKAAKPTIGKLVARVRNSFERWSWSEA